MSNWTKWFEISGPLLIMFIISVSLNWVYIFQKANLKEDLKPLEQNIDSLQTINDSLETQINWFERYLQPNIDSISSRSGDTLVTRLLISYAIRSRIPPLLLASVARQESNYTPAARGRDGESGMLQVIPRLWWGLVINKCGYWLHGDLEQEICAGASVLSWYYYTKCKEESWTCALSRYNTGLHPKVTTVGRNYAADVLGSV